MNLIFKYIFNTMGYLLSWLVPTIAGELCLASISHVYTGYLKRQFFYIGKDSLLAFRAHKLYNLHRVSIGCGSQIEKGASLEAWGSKRNDKDSPLIKIGDNLYRYCDFNSALNEYENWYSVFGLDQYVVFEIKFYE